MNKLAILHQNFKGIGFPQIPNMSCFSMNWALSNVDSPRTPDSAYIQWCFFGGKHYTLENMYHRDLWFAGIEGPLTLGTLVHHLGNLIKNPLNILKY